MRKLAIALAAMLCGRVLFARLHTPPFELYHAEQAKCLATLRSAKAEAKGFPRAERKKRIAAAKDAERQCETRAFEKLQATLHQQSSDAKKPK